MKFATKFTKRNFKKLTALSLCATGLLALGGCMTQEEMDALNASLANGPSPKPTPVMPPDLQPACFNERFVQPHAEISRSIDVLFVMDTSGSMSDNRAKVADGLSAFVAELPSNVDYQVGVMLAHGSKSGWSGKMFKYGSNTIFSSKTMTVNTISTQLKDMVLHAPTDDRGEQGEMGSYSLMKGLGANYAANQATGFFRPNAALAVVFVSDENDICAPYLDFPDLSKAPGLTTDEKTLRIRDCGVKGIATQDVINKVKSVQGTRPYLFGGVVHQSLGYSDSNGNDGYGFGAMEIIKASNGVSTEINDGSYTQGLADMGKLATIKLNLILDYTLARTNINPQSIQTFVDGKVMGFTYDPAANDVHLNEGGGALSIVDVNYCLKSAGPSPSPTPTPGPGDGPGTPGPRD